MRWWHRLDVRLFASYAAVTATGATVLLLTTRELAPHLFDRRLEGAGEPGRMMGDGPSMHDALGRALDDALAVALLASLVAAAVVAGLVARRILGPIGEVRRATRRLAAGHYDERVDLPAEPELAGLAADVNALGRTLDDSERRRAQLVGDVAHELRTPLTTIRGYAEGMVDGVIAPDEGVLRTILAEVERLQRLAADLATLSRADEGTSALQLAPVDLAALATTIVTELGPAARAKEVDLAVASTTPCPVHGDPDRLSQVLTNLVGNAITYTPAGGRITVEVTADAGACTVTVADTGIGLASDEVGHVFERFYRVAGVDRPPGGSGIGLAIARAIARAHGGDVTAESAGEGQGTTFALRLPHPSGPLSVGPAGVDGAHRADPPADGPGPGRA